MQQKTHDFLVRMQVPMATFGGDLMGEAIDFAIQEMRNNRFVTLTDIENVLSDRFHCSASSADARLRTSWTISPMPLSSFLIVLYRYLMKSPK